MANKRIDPPTLTAQEIERFWNYVDKTKGHGPSGQCWVWTRCILSTGYGQYRPGERAYSTHRLSFFFTYSYWPNIHVCHYCDNRACCNPSHLFEGDDAANMQDAKRKGRTTQGEKDGMSKLTAGQVLAIRTLLASDTRQYLIAKQFGVSEATISMIKHGHRWTHL